MAGGGWLPIRWSAASTSAMTARRLSSECESASAVALRLANLSLAAAPRARRPALWPSFRSARRRGAPDRRERNRFRLSIARRCSSDWRSVSSTPRSSSSLSARCWSVWAGGFAGGRWLRERAASRAERRRPRRPSARNLSIFGAAASAHGPSNLANIGADRAEFGCRLPKILSASLEVSCGDRGVPRELSSPDRAVRRPSRAPAGAATSSRRN